MLEKKTVKLNGSHSVWLNNFPQRTIGQIFIDLLDENTFPKLNLAPVSGRFDAKSFLIIEQMLR